MSLDMGLGTLRFARNGRDLGVAVQGLEGMLYPAFSMYNRSEQSTMTPRAMPPERVKSSQCHPICNISQARLPTRTMMEGNDV